MLTFCIKSLVVIMKICIFAPRNLHFVSLMRGMKQEKGERVTEKTLRIEENHNH